VRFEPNDFQLSLFPEQPMSKMLATLIERFKTVVDGGEVPRPTDRFGTYAITNFRGGIGKSTLAFNLAYEVSRTNRTLLMDLCPQCNFTQSLLGDDIASVTKTVYDALLPQVMAGTPEISSDDLLVSVPPVCISFKGGQKVCAVPGSKDLFLFPSLLYTQLSAASQLGQRSKNTMKNMLQSVQQIAANLGRDMRATKTILDTSPFFGGATHLGWVAADALIIPVRVDQHSMEALKLTLSMLRSSDMDFLRLNALAGIKKVPKIHAVVMTHCGWNRQTAFTPDRSTQAYLSQVIEIVTSNSELFSTENPLDCIHLLDDFHSAGRISGSKRIPLAELAVGQSHTIEGQRLEVNESLQRYQRELKSLASCV
jgi:chromosome partitioning protein